MNSRLLSFVSILTALATLPAYAGGTLINVDAYQALASDRRAFRVGDPLTVLVVENAMAASSAATGVDKEWGVGGHFEVDDRVHNGSAGLSGDSDGAGRTIREGKLQAQLAVRVIAIEPNDLLRVFGEQMIIINGEQQTISIEGLVRREDIGPDNAVLSPRLADVTISFTGDGVVAESQKRSWIFKLFQWLGLI